ncbi:OPT superfamily [Salix suchowensis]|nr:OPT superfamily [Salix suchowensis]
MFSSNPSKGSVGQLTPEVQNVEKANRVLPIYEKKQYLNTDIESTQDVDADSDFGGVLENERDIATHILTVTDDPSLNPWTVRAFVLGMGLSAFGECWVWHGKPSFPVTEYSASLIQYVAYRPFQSTRMHPFNKKENAFIVIMSSAAANSALGTEVLAVQRLFYNVTPNPASSIFLLFASQLLGYGIGGLFRSKLGLHCGIVSLLSRSTRCPAVPLEDVIPNSDPVGVHVRCVVQGRARRDQEVEAVLDCIWSVSHLPQLASCRERRFTSLYLIQYIRMGNLPGMDLPLLTGFSIFCLANPTSTDFTRIFGGSNGNEGLGLLSLCLDWQYISGGTRHIRSRIFALSINDDHCHY